MNKTIHDIAFNLVERGNNKENLFTHYANYIHLLTALHDAINSPKGVVPESAEKFYCVSYYKEKK